MHVVAHSPDFFEAGVTDATFAPNVYESAEQRQCAPLAVGMTRLLFRPDRGVETLPRRPASARKQE
jgi:hypothetical protein